jgi:FkbM family methyltransferase
MQGLANSVPCSTVDTVSIINMHSLGRIAKLPLSLIPAGMVVWIPAGGLRGKRWVVGSALHRCWLGFYEHAKQRVIYDEVRPGTIFYDIGANVGFYSLLASKLVGSGQVYAFEPVPRNLYFLKKHLELNSVSNVEVLERAVSDRVGVAQFQLEPTGFMGHLSEAGAITVSTVSLDSLLEQQYPPPPNYIKMDIEGAELMALRGARRTIEQYRPILFLATHGRQMHRECCQLLESWGYECRFLTDVTSNDRGEVVARFRR